MLTGLAIVFLTLTLISTVMLPITFIAGVYGMNFKHMPELEWEYGYFAVMSAILIVCAALYWRFRRVGWL